MSFPISQFIPPPPPPHPAFLPLMSYVCSLHLHLYFCLANRFIELLYPLLGIGLQDPPDQVKFPWPVGFFRDRGCDRVP